MSRETAISKMRLLFRDYGEAFRDEFVSDGSRTFYDLSQTNVDTDTLTVVVDGVVVTTGFDLEPRNGTITFDTAPTAGDEIVVAGTGGLFSLDVDIGAFIDIAFDLHAKGRVPALSWDTISGSEEYAIALLALREALWAEIAEHAHQVDVTTPEGMHIPGGQQFTQLMSMLELVERHYRDIASVLNVGPWAIEMFTLRRVSRTTNRLVPLYVPQEFDDHSTPVRIYPPIGPGV
jgi:hypothetical protein